MFAERIDVEPSHIFDPVQRLLLSVDARSLNSVDRMCGGNMLGKFKKLHVTAQARRNKYWRLLVAVLNPHDGFEAPKTRLFKKGSEGGNSAGVADRSNRDLAAINPSYLGKNLVG